MTEERISAKLRSEIATRARQCCEYCRSQARFAMQSFAVEHIEPRSEDGATQEPGLSVSGLQQSQIQQNACN